MSNRIAEQSQTTMETAKTKEFQGGEEATVAKQVEEDIVDVSGQL